MKQELDLTTLARAPVVYSFDLSPVEPKVAFNWNRTGQWELYLMDLAPGAEPRQITAGPESKTAPCWSPDSKIIARHQVLIVQVAIITNDLGAKLVPIAGGATIVDKQHHPPTMPLDHQ